MPSSGPSTRLAIIYNGDTSVRNTLSDLAIDFGFSALHMQDKARQTSQVLFEGVYPEINFDMIKTIKRTIEDLHGSGCAKLRYCPQGHSVVAMEVHLP